jgi:hypothetical protein
LNLKCSFGCDVCIDGCAEKLDELAAGCDDQLSFPLVVVGGAVCDIATDANNHTESPAQIR